MDRRAAVLLGLACFSLLALTQQARASTPAAPVPDLLRTPIQTVAVNSYDQIFAGTFGNGIYASPDGGRTWAASNGDLRNKNVFALVVKSHMVYAGTFGGGVFKRSDDRGSRWVQVNAGLDCPEVICLEIDPRGGMYAGTSIGEIYSSRDDGEQWSLIGDVGEYVNTIAVDNDRRIFVGTSHGIYRSDDQGKTWVRSATGLSCSDVWSLTVNTNGHIFAATNGGGVFRSVDKGANWVPVNSGLATKNAGSVAVCPNGNIFVGTTEGVFVSYNDGETWSSFVCDPSSKAVRCLSLGLAGQLLVGTHWVDIFETDPVQPVPEEAEDGE